MNYKSLYFLFAFLFIYGCGSTEVPIDQLTYKNGLKVLKESGEPFTGKSIRFEGEGTAPIEIIEYKEGKLDGNIQFFYANGKIKEDFYARLQSEFYMLAQAFDMSDRGRDTSQLDDGALTFLVRYGEEHKWHDNGEMASEGKYSEDGARKIGVWRTWYKNGELEEEGVYSSLPVANNGKAKRRSNVDGVKIDQWKHWYENGKINTEELYNKDGKKNGIWKTYCKNGTVGKEVEFKKDIVVGTKKYWACNGKELDQINYVDGKQHGRFVSYATKKRTASDSLINTVDYAGKIEYDIKFEDFFKAKEGFFDKGEKSGLWTTWDKTGKITSITDYSKDNFLNPEYSKAFLKKGKFGPFASGYSSWKVNYFNFKGAKPDIEATQLYLKRNLINPAKKIMIEQSGGWGWRRSTSAGVSEWTYPIIVAPEVLYNEIKAYPGVKLDSVDTKGRNRLHLCTILMLGKRPDRCSLEHFNTLLKDIPVNTADNEGMTAMNYVAEFMQNSRRRLAATESVAVEAIKSLVKAGADINHQNAKGQTALMRALSHKKYKTAKTLLDLGANVNVKDAEGNNAIHYAFFQAVSNTYKYKFKLDEDRKEILTLLVQKGAQIDVLNLKEKTVKDVAIQKGFINTALFLESLSKLKVETVKIITAETPVEIKLVDKGDSQKENKESSLNTDVVKAANESIQDLEREKASEKFDSVVGTIDEVEDISFNQPEQLYQTALAQIKRSRLSKPKGDSALDTLNEMISLTSENDSKVLEIRQKIVDKYLSLARGRIKDYRYQDAIRFIKTSQRIQPTKKARQLLARVDDAIAEEALFQQQQQQKINASRQAAPPVREKSSFGSMFKSIFD